MYIAKFQDSSDYYDNLDNATFDQAIKFLNYKASIAEYKQASIYEKDTGREVFSYRTIR
jgi:hypothetical protein